MNGVDFFTTLLVSWSPLAWLYQWWHAAPQAADFWRHDVLAAGCAVLVALLLDRVLGEPPAWLHPVVAMGKILEIVGKKIAPTADISRDCKSFILGMTSWCALAAMVFMLYAGLQFLLPPMAWWWQGVVVGVLLKPLLAWRMLQTEVLAVESALQHSLAQGRDRLSWLVSRDTTQLDAGTVRESAIETLAENLNDSVMAPLFWFAVLGLPGAALYRFANTADAMWGYPGWRGQGAQRRHWQWAGKWAARADDGLSWIPARMTAGLLALVAGGVSLRHLWRDAGLTPSPNGGWTMGAMALALGVRLGKPQVYVLNATGAVPQAQHVQRAVRLAAQAVGSVVLGVVIAMGLLMVAGVLSHA